MSKVHYKGRFYIRVHVLCRGCGGLDASMKVFFADINPKALAVKSKFYRRHMGSSQNYGPLITAPNT